MRDDLKNPEGIFNVPNDHDEYGEPIPPEADEPPVEGELPVEDNQDQTPPVDTQPETPAKPDKRVQTPEENAKFAEMRRQKEMQERFQSTPEYQMAQLLAKQYGMPVEQLYQEFQKAVLQRQAKEQGVPVEVLQRIESERKAREELEARLNQTEFKNWYQEKQNEAIALKQQYPFLSDDDIIGAINYMLEDLGTVKMPLAQAVMALHGDRIAAELRKVAKQEALAEVSGRKQGPLAPQTSKGAQTPTMTEEERYVARKMGISEEDYIKYRDME